MKMLQGARAVRVENVDTYFLVRLGWSHRFPSLFAQSRFRVLLSFSVMKVNGKWKIKSQMWCSGSD